MGTRTGMIGDCYEYSRDGKRLAGTDRLTIDTMVSLSADWPDAYHQYVGPDGYTTWAHAGREISESELPPALKGEQQ